MVGLSKKEKAEGKKVDAIIKHKGMIAGLTHIWKSHSHNQKDYERDDKRLKQTRGGIAVGNNHTPIPHHRLRGHIDNLNKRAGGDSRQRVMNNNHIARRKKDNDAINIDRPLG